MTTPRAVPDPPVGWGEDDDRVPVYDDHVTFVREYLTPRFAREFTEDTAIWCPWWQQHPEADTALESLWRAWEDCTNPDRGRGLAYWLTMFAYPIMERLFAPSGTFYGCSLDKHTPYGTPLITA